MKTTKQVAEEIVALVKENGMYIRGYEGEVSCVFIESKLDHNDDGAEIANGTMEVS